MINASSASLLREPVDGAPPPVEGDAGMFTDEGVDLGRG